MKAWIKTQPLFYGDAITPCSNFNGDLIKQPLKMRMSEDTQPLTSLVSTLIPMLV